MRELRRARGTEQARLLQAQLFSRLDQSRDTMRDREAPGLDMYSQDLLLTTQWVGLEGRVQVCWEVWSVRLCGVQRLSVGNMETVIHQRVIIRLLTTFTPEIRTAGEPAGSRAGGRREEGVQYLHTSLYYKLDSTSKEE